MRDCAFDRTAINTADVMSGNPLFSDYGWNAYRTNTTQTTPTGANNLLVDDFHPGRPGRWGTTTCWPIHRW